MNNKNKSLWEHLKSKDITILDFKDFFKHSSSRVLFALETESMYEGYIKIQNQRISIIKQMETTLIPDDFNYQSILNLSSESVEKLTRIKPENLAQAAIIDGVRQSDLSILSFYLYKRA